MPVDSHCSVKFGLSQFGDKVVHSIFSAIRNTMPTSSTNHCILQKILVASYI